MTKPNPFSGGPAGATATAPAKKAPAKKAANGAPPESAEDNVADTSLGRPAAPAQKRTDPFATPSGGGSDYAAKDLIGELLLIRPSEIDSMYTKVSKPGEGPSPYARAEVWRLENPGEDGQPEYIEEFLWFQEGIIRAMKKVLRGPNALSLGRLIRGQEKNGKSAPYLLDPATPEETEQALAWCEANGISLDVNPNLPD